AHAAAATSQASDALVTSRDNGRMGATVSSLVGARRKPGTDDRSRRAILNERHQLQIAVLPRCRHGLNDRLRKCPAGAIDRPRDRQPASDGAVFEETTAVFAAPDVVGESVLDNPCDHVKD